MVKILIVEDELIIAEDMSMLLTEMGYEVLETAMDCEEALETLQSETPDLILLDVNLGGKKDGIDLAKEINERFQIPFIFTTSYSDGPTIERANEVNPTNYLVKPFKKEQLYAAIEMALLKIAGNKIEKPDSDDGLIIKDALFIKEKYRYTKLPIANVLWIKTEGNYIEIHLHDKKELVRMSLTHFLEKANRSNFFRTHKSYAVNLDFMTKFEPSSISILETEIPITRTYAEELMKRIEVM
jgi:DNA-binding LytR/AlgR family response regulator